MDMIPKLLRELRLMKDQSDHRFYAVCAVVVLVMVATPIALALLAKLHL